MSSWWEQPFLGLDTETTGVDTANDRIVTVSIVRVEPGTRPVLDKWLIAVDIDIPAGAEAIHGISTAFSHEHGSRAAEVLDVVAADLALAMHRGTPVVAFNAPFDFTILENELARNGLPTVAQRLGTDVRPVVDGRVLDKATSRRKGSRKLTDCCAHYGILLGDAHEASADALAAVRLATVIVRKNASLSSMTLDELHDAQIAWCREQSTSLQLYFRNQPGKSDVVVCGHWPVCDGSCRPVSAVA